MLRLSAIGGDAAPCRAGPASDQGGESREGGGGRREDCGRGGGWPGGRRWGPSLRDPRRQRVTAAAVSSAGSVGPLLGHRAPSTAVAAVAADSCSRSRRLLPSPPARSPSLYRPPAEPRAACSGCQPGRDQPGLQPLAGPHPPASPALANTSCPSYPKAEPEDLACPLDERPSHAPPFPPDPSLKTSLEASATSQLLSRL